MAWLIGRQCARISFFSKFTSSMLQSKTLVFNCFLESSSLHVLNKLRMMRGFFFLIWLGISDVVRRWPCMAGRQRIFWIFFDNRKALGYGFLMLMQRRVSVLTHVCTMCSSYWTRSLHRVNHFQVFTAMFRESPVQHQSSLCSSYTWIQGSYNSVDTLSQK